MGTSSNNPNVLFNVLLICSAIVYSMHMGERSSRTEVQNDTLLGRTSLFLWARPLFMRSSLPGEMNWEAYVCISPTRPAAAPLAGFIFPSVIPNYFHYLWNVLP